MIEDGDKEKQEEEKKNKRPDFSKLEQVCTWDCSVDSGCC